MTIKEASTHLLKKGIHVDRVSRTRFRVWDVAGPVKEPWRKGAHPDDLWTGREVLFLARAYMDSTSQPSVHKCVKRESNGKDRSFARDEIMKDEFDRIPSKRRCKQGDIWSWD